MKALRRAGITAAWWIAFGISGAAVAAPDRLSAEIDPGATVPLRGALHPLVQRSTDLGRLDPATRLDNVSLHFGRSPQQQAALDFLLAEQQRPGSPAWHQWLTPAGFGERFGLGDGDLQRVQRWLGRAGLTVTGVAAGRNQVTVSGTAGQLERALGVELHRYRYDGQTHFASATEPQLPRALDGMVLGIRHLDDFKLRPLGLSRRPAGAVTPQFNGGGSHQLVPDDIATIYDIQPLYQNKIDGTGISIAVVGRAVISLTDIEAFRADAGLPANDPTVVAVPGTGSSAGTSDPNDVIESDLDLEWAGGIAYGSTIEFVTTNAADGYDVTDAISYAIQADLAPIISASYGTCEDQTTATDISTFTSLGQQANAQGQTLVVASGDDGAAACESTSTTGGPASTGLAVNFPADLAQATAVGGTEFSGDVNSPSTYWSAVNASNGGSAKQYIPETAWNDSDAANLSAGGGGVSRLVAKPAWQGGTGVPADGQRDLPDIAFTASPNHDPYLICTSSSSGSTTIAACAGNGFANDTPIPYGGTSAAAPVFAGMLALLEQSVGSTGEGNVNPALYTLAATPATYATVFHDVTTGNNAVPCVSGSTDCPAGTKTIGYDAGTGYDLVTGLGSIDVNALAQVFPAGPLILTTTQIAINPNRVQQGDFVTLTATITPASQGANAVLGTVQFALDGSNTGDPVTVVNKQATLSISLQNLGIHTISATYLGTSSYALSQASGTVSVLALPPSQDSKQGGGGALPPLMLGLLTTLAGWRRRLRRS